MPLNIVITDADTVFDRHVSPEVFSGYGTVVTCRLEDEEDIREKLANADVVLCNKTVFDAARFALAPKLKYIGLFATGYNNIDLAEASRRGVVVCNAPAYSTEAVAQHTFALLLELTDRVCKYNETVRIGDWIKSRTFSYFPLPHMELAAKTIGLVGYGAIGRRVADIALAFGMRVLVMNRSKINDPRVTQVEFDTLLAESDVLSLHCPLNAQSADLMDATAFAKMRDGAYFINTARGGLVVEEALAAALNSGKLAGAGIDVLRTEPMKPDCALIGLENCVITPHVSWAGPETRRRLLSVVEDNLAAFLAGTPKNQVN
ncbi:MAG: D-2-hydroxyacid dehydrogenase [Clostridia bacterium]|nr:D-2-hydroxyacid dehydrogenase [Clostridia bacterium]